jgi:hypothetical protein
VTPTRAEALAAGLDIVEDIAAGQPRRKGGDFASRDEAVLAVAEFLLGYDDAETGEELTTRTSRPTRSRGVQLITCNVRSPGDYAYTRAWKSGGRPPFVGLEVVVDGKVAQVAISPRHARAFAAGVLNAADEAEGASPLLWTYPKEEPS